MKKVMIYSKHTDFNKRTFSETARESSGLIMLFITFLCGLFSGSMFAVNADNIASFSFLFSPVINSNIKQYFFSALFFFLSIWLMSTAGGMSCFGMIFQLISVFMTGFTTAFFASYLILTYSTDGLGKFCLSVFPGTIISSCALITFGNKGNKMSLIICSKLLSGQQEKEDVKSYFISSIICLSLFLVGILINAIFIGIFSAL